MKNEDCLRTNNKNNRKELISTDGTITSHLLFGKGKYRLWVLFAILLLALCSIFTGTITLKWSSSSSGNLNRFSTDADSMPILDDLDVLEIEEMEKVVNHMWEVYTHSQRIRLPKFWQEAFEAAFDDLVSDVPAISRSAISEIAKMSIRRRSIIDLDHAHHSTKVSIIICSQVNSIPLSSFCTLYTFSISSGPHPRGSKT